jgi:hypothetical protein
MELSWSRWVRCESSFGLLLIPDLPGIFALAEEVAPPSGIESRRMLAVFEVNEADRLVQSLSRLFVSGNRWYDRLKGSSCYLRYAVVADPERRRSAAEALKNWLSSQKDVVAQTFERPASASLPIQREAATVAERAVDRVMAARSPIPAGF